MKKWLFAFALTIAVLLCVSCGREEQQYMYPLSQDDVEQVLGQLEIPLTVEKVENLNENLTVFHLQNDEGFFSLIQTYGTEGVRILEVDVRLPHPYAQEKIDHFNEYGLPLYFDFAGALYGQSKDAKTAYDNFTAYLSEQKRHTGHEVRWEEEIGGYNYKVSLRYSNNIRSTTGFTIWIKNKEAEPN